MLRLFLPAALTNDTGTNIVTLPTVASRYLSHVSLWRAFSVVLFHRIEELSPPPAKVLVWKKSDPWAYDSPSTHSGRLLGAHTLFGLSFLIAPGPSSIAPHFTCSPCLRIGAAERGLA